MQIKLVSVIFFLLLFSVNIHAGELAYTCQVSNVYSLTEQGALKASYLESTMKDEKFSVSRITGEITGQVIPTFMAESTRVINIGTSENSFKAIADFGNQFQIIEIQEFRTGTVKPFVASSMGGAGVVTGTCE